MSTKGDKPEVDGRPMSDEEWDVIKQGLCNTLNDTKSAFGLSLMKTTEKLKAMGTPQHVGVTAVTIGTAMVIHVLTHTLRSAFKMDEEQLAAAIRVAGELVKHHEHEITSEIERMRKKNVEGSSNYF